MNPCDFYGSPMTINPSAYFSHILYLTNLTADLNKNLISSFKEPLDQYQPNPLCIWGMHVRSNKRPIPFQRIIL